MIRTVLILVACICILFSCKKDNKTNTNAAPPSYTGGGNGISIQAYPNNIGNSWVYSFYSKVMTSYNNTITTYTNAYNYTLTVIADTIMPNNNKGKIWRLTFSSFSDTLRHVAFLDSANNLFKVQAIEYPYSAYAFIALNYPLTQNKTWENTGQLPLDTSKVTSQESNMLVVDRGYWTISGTYKYKINNLGLVYSLYERTEIVGGQITVTDYENTLLSTNF